MSRRSLVALILSCPLWAASTWASPVATNLVVNGSFELLTPGSSQASGTWGTYNGIYGWQSSPTVEVRNNVSGSTPYGSSFVELDTDRNNGRNSSIWQMINTVVGQTYLLSFSYAQRPDNHGEASNGLCWQAGDMPCAAFGQDSNLGWTTVSTSFVAQGSQTRLRFAAIGTADTYGTSLDNVGVIAQLNSGQNASDVPEPASLALALVGLSACGLASRRRKG